MLKTVLKTIKPFSYFLVLNISKQNNFAPFEDFKHENVPTWCTRKEHIGNSALFSISRVSSTLPNAENRFEND